MYISINNIYVFDVTRMVKKLDALIVPPTNVMMGVCSFLIYSIGTVLYGMYLKVYRVSIIIAHTMS